MQQLPFSLWLSVALCVVATGVARADQEPPKLPGTAAPFASIPWGSTPETVKSGLTSRGYQFAEADQDGDLVFTGKTGPITATVFEVFDNSRKLVKSLVVIRPAAADLIDLFHTLSTALGDKHGKPSVKLEAYRGKHRDPQSDSERRAAIAAGDAELGTFWFYADGSSMYVDVTSTMSIETGYESPRWAADMARRHAAAAASSAANDAAKSAEAAAAGAAAAAAAAANAGANSTARAAATPAAANAAGLVYAGPTGWDHVQGTSDGLGSWLRTGDTDYSQNVSVLTKDGFASLDALVRAELTFIGGLQDESGFAASDITVCGNHPAKHLSYTYTASTGARISTEAVVAVFGTAGYSARYNRLASQSADPAAERSLKSLCARSAQ